MTPINAGFISELFKLIGKLILGLFKYLSLAILYAIGGVVLYAVWKFNPFSGDIYSVLYLVGFGFSVLLSLLIPFSIKGKKKKEKRSSKKIEEEEVPLSWWEKRKAKKALALEREQEEIERQERLAREEDLKAQERRLEELRAERIKEEIAREERLIEEYRHEAAVSAYNRYEEVVAPHPIPTEEEINYFGAPISQSRVPNIDTIGNSYNDNGYVNRQVGYDNSSQPNTSVKVSNVVKETPKIYMSAVEEDVLIHEYSDRFEVYKLNGGEKTLTGIEYKNKQ